MEEWIPDMVDDEEMARILDAQEEEERSHWHITNDLKADWAIKKIKEIEGEHDRLIRLYDRQISELTEKLKKEEEAKERETGFFRFKLLEYFGTVKTKESKTQKTYRLGAGSLVYTKEKQSIKKVDDSALVNFLNENGMSDFVKVEQKPDWAEVKKHLIMQDGEVVTDDGVVVPADICCIEQKPGEFKVK